MTAVALTTRSGCAATRAHSLPRQDEPRTTSAGGCAPSRVERARRVRVVQKLDVPRRVTRAREEDRGVRPLLLAVRDDVQEEPPQRKGVLAALVPVRRERIVVERTDPGEHLALVACPMLLETRDIRVVRGPQLDVGTPLGLRSL